MRIFFVFFFLLIVCSVFSSAQLVITPQVNNFQVFSGVSKGFSLNFFNNNSFSLRNISFSPVAGITFPVVPVLFAGESRGVDVVVYSAVPQSWSGLSLVSFLYDVPFNVSPVNVSVNVSNVSVSPSLVQLFSGDGVLWSNLFNESIVLRDLGGSGFPELVLPGGSSVFVLYPMGNFSFYAFPFGFTGNLVVVPRPSSTLVHSSSFDVPVSFSVTASLVASSLDVVVFNNNFSSNPNQSQSGILEVKNLLNIPVVNVSLSSPNGWIAFFDSGFDIPALGNRLVQFNLTPRLNFTSETNRSYNVSFLVGANNVDSFNRSVSLFVSYSNLDIVIINGSQCVINRLSVPETITFCRAFPADVECLGLSDAFRSNVTVVKEVPAKQLIDEPTLLKIQQQASIVGDIATRAENSNNINKDLLLSVASRFDEFALQMNQTQHDYNLSVAAAQRRNSDLSARQNWLVGGFLVGIIFLVIVWFVGYNLWIKYMVKGGQL